MYGMCLVFEGMIIGVCDLFVFFGVEVDFYLILQIVLIENGDYIVILKLGNIFFVIVIVKKGGDIEFCKNIGFLRVNVDELKIKY